MLKLTGMDKNKDKEFKHLYIKRRPSLPEVQFITRKLHLNHHIETCSTNKKIAPVAVQILEPIAISSS